jgi:hypothetical protein
MRNSLQPYEVTPAMNLTAQWDLGYVIGLAVCIVIAAVAVILGLLGWYKAAHSSGYSGDGWAITALASAFVLLVVTGIGLFIATPFSGQYHRFVPKTGTVAQVGSRIVSSGSGNSTSVNQKFVVTLKDGESYGCLDTRCANVAPGDNLTLMCERVFQFNAPNEGWDCNWGVDVKPNGVLVQ